MDSGFFVYGIFVVLVRVDDALIGASSSLYVRLQLYMYVTTSIVDITVEFVWCVLQRVHVPFMQIWLHALSRTVTVLQSSRKDTPEHAKRSRSVRSNCNFL